jgi:pimeloyl-ACP methyl ester carboxylesterase
VRVRGAITFVAALASASALGAGHMVSIDTRPGVRVGYWMMERPDAVAAVVLLPGGAGSIGMKGGVPTSTNFLVRSREMFAAAGFDVAIVGLDLAFRACPEHVQDLKRVVERVRADTGKPVWLVGTSRGTVSAAAAAIALGPAIDGVVLTSSITDPALPQSVQNLDLARIRVPVLVVHHKRDACRATPPEQAPRVVEGLVNASARRLVMVDGGSGAHGGWCQPMQWHGFIGMEQQAVDAIADFIRDRRPEPPR